MSLHPSIRRAVLCLIGALLIFTALTACEKTAPISPNPPAAQPAQNPSTAPAASADPGEAEPADDAQTVPAIKGGVDADADTVEGIPTKNASELWI